MDRLQGIASSDEIRKAISELEALGSDAQAVSVAAVHVFKSELGPASADEPKREILFERIFTIPGGPLYQLGKRLGGRPGRRSNRPERFRERCDRYFYEEMVPVIERNFGAVAEPFMNTINEAILNYSEYSFRPGSLFRRVVAQVFRTDGDLAYAIIRPAGTGLRSFDPLSLRKKTPGTIKEMHRGWGHALLMSRALFISFDHAPKRRGLMVVVGRD